MPKIKYQVDSDLPPDRILAAAKDFTERRPELWPNVDRRFYEIHEVTDTYADVTEGTNVMGGVWARERYEWPEPDTIVGTVVDSNIFQPGGTWTMRVTPHNGGSRVEVVSARRPKGKGRLPALVMSIVGRKVFADHLRKTLAIIERQPAA